MQISTHIVSICESRPPGLTLEPAGCGPPRGRNVWRDRGCQGLFQRGWGTGPGRGHRPGTVRALPRLHCRLWFPLGQFLLTRVQVNSSSLCLVHPPKERSLHVRGRRLSVRAVCPQEPLGCSPSPSGLVDCFFLAFSRTSGCQGVLRTVRRMGDGRTCPGTGARPRHAFGAGAGSACSAAGPGCPLFSLQLPRPARRNAALGPPAAASREPEARAWGSPGVPREPTAGPACLLHRGPHPPGRPRAPRPRSPRRPGVERASCCHEQQVASAWCSCRLGGAVSSPRSRDSRHFTVSRQRWMTGRFTVSPPRRMASVLRPEEGCGWAWGCPRHLTEGCSLCVMSVRCELQGLMLVSVADDRPPVPASPGVLTPPSDRGGPWRPGALVRRPWRSAGRGQRGLRTDRWF